MKRKRKRRVNIRRFDVLKWEGEKEECSQYGEEHQEGRSEGKRQDVIIEQRSFCLSVNLLRK